MFTEKIPLRHSTCLLLFFHHLVGQWTRCSLIIVEILQCEASIKHFQKAMIERISRKVILQTNTKRFYRKTFKGLGQQRKFVAWTRPLFPSIPFTSALLALKYPRRGGSSTTLNILRAAMFTFMKLCLAILTWGVKLFFNLFASFIRFLPVKT